MIEPYLSAKANPLTDALCRQAIPMALPALLALIEHEDADARDALAWVSLSGGLALANAGLGAVHGFAGPIGGRTDAAHGAICGALLAPVLDALAARAEPGSELARRVAEVAGWIGTALGVASSGAFEALARTAHALGLPRLSMLGVSPVDHGALAEDARTSSSMKASAVAFTHEELVEMLRAAG